MNFRINSSMFEAGYSNMNRYDSNAVSYNFPDEQDNSSTRRMARELLRSSATVAASNQKKTFVGTLDDDKNPLLMYGMPDDSQKDKEVTTKKLNYNANEVANAIQRAKTSTSAAGTVSKAKRKVAELKRKLANKDADTGEIRIALAHARSLERVATKKKRHLELEELVNNARRNQENQEKTENESSDMVTEIAETVKDKMSEQSQDRIDELYEKMEQLIVDYQESEEYSSDFEAELIQSMDDMMSEFEEMQSKTLSEAFDALDAIEIADPHMSEDDFKMFKIKHRNSENKDIVKANMEYLKSLIEHYEKSPTSSVPGVAPGVSSQAVIPVESGVSADVNIDIKL